VDINYQGRKSDADMWWAMCDVENGKVGEMRGAGKSDVV
jgi:hypothetical protein